MPSRWWWFRRGLWPRGRAYRTMARDCRDAGTFNEKLQRKMVYDRNPILVTFADKVAVRDYVREVSGEQHLTQLHAVARRARDVEWAALPREFAAKVNHASGGVILVTASADPAVPLPPVGSRIGFRRIAVHPDRADPERIADLLDHWLTMEYSWEPGGRPEWAYQHVPRRILVEELLPFSASGEAPVEYKMFTFHGRVQRVLVFHRNAPAGERAWAVTASAVMSPEWERVPVVVDPGILPPDSPSPARPPRLEQMIRLAEALAAPVDFVRVDLYAVDDRIVVSELTNYPSAARCTYDPPEYDRELGSSWVQVY